MLHVGLTGGIGSGKSTVDRLFGEKGAYIIDFDSLAHSVEAPGGAAWKEIVAHFGDAILNEDNSINRQKLADIVFRNGTKLSQLNSIVHPAVFARWERTIDTLVKQQKDRIIISDIPLLIEVKWHHYVDCIILVYISPEEQIKRIMKRNGYTRREAVKRLNSQMPIDDKIPYADFIVNNEGPLEETRKAIDEIWETLVRLEKQKQ